MCLAGKVPPGHVPNYLYVRRIMKFTVKYDENMMLESARCYLWKNLYYRIMPWIIVVLFLALVLYVLKVNVLALIALTSVVILVAIILSSYLSWMRLRKQAFKLLGEGIVEYEITNDEFIITAETMKNEMKWSFFVTFQEHGRWIFLIYPGGGFVSLPIDIVAKDAIELIKKKFA